MVLSSEIQCKIFELYIAGNTAFSISNQLQINYRTAIKYTAAIDLILDKIKNAVALCILAQMKKTSTFST